MTRDFMHTEYGVECIEDLKDFYKEIKLTKVQMARLEKYLLKSSTVEPLDDAEECASTKNTDNNGKEADVQLPASGKKEWAIF